LIVKVN